MKRTLLCMCVVLIAVMVFGVAGCTREAYTQEQMDQITQKGMEMMRAWLDENMPEAEIENCEALSLWSYDHAMYLTDYVAETSCTKEKKCPLPSIPSPDRCILTISSRNLPMR